VRISDEADDHGIAQFRTFRPTPESSLSIKIGSAASVLSVAEAEPIEVAAPLQQRGPHNRILREMLVYSNDCQRSPIVKMSCQAASTKEISYVERLDR
jgi:hypothetical protein